MGDGMKRFLLATVGLLILISFFGCTKETQYGSCVGINDEKNPALIYKYSEDNIIISAIFIETVVVPVIVIFNELQCPVGVKEIKK